jgi:hypothetical protein
MADPETQELRRDRELLGRRGSKAHEDMIQEFRRIMEGFRDQAERSDKIMDFWDIYNCVLNQNQVYNGNAQLYVPIVRNAVQARKTRFLNQIFPASGRYIDATSSDAQVPHAIVALLEDYVRKTSLRTQMIAAMLRNGDIEGQYNLYVDWNRTSRHVVSRETIRPQIAFDGMPPDLAGGRLRPLEGGEAPEPVETIVEAELVDDHPTVEIIHDTDILVLPVTAASIDDALAAGGSVTLIRRWTKSQVEDMIDKGEIRKREGQQLLEIVRRQGDDTNRSIEKELVDAAGIKGRGKFFQAYETWKCIEGDDGRRLTKSLYGGYDLILSCRRNPMWNDRCQLLSCPQEKIAGVFKGTSPIEGGVASIQYHANDIANQAADSATYSMLPIIMTDPAKNPRTATMILNLAAIWEVDPNSTRFAEFPKLWQDGIALIQSDTALIFQTMGVNPAMMPQSSGRPGGRRNQAEVAMEQTVDILTTAEACSVIEEGILSPMLTRWVEMDHQFRDEEATVRTYGELGHAAKMEAVPPLQSTTRYHFTWFGVEQARNAAQQQQQIAFLNVARGMSEDLQRAGYLLDPAPALEHAAGNIFGWRMGRLIIKDQRAQLAVDPSLENQMLEQGFDVGVHPMDEDPRHMQVHLPLTRHPNPTVAASAKVHMQRHQVQQGMKAQAQAAMQQPGQPGTPPLAPGMPGQSGRPGPTPPAPGGQAPGPRLLRGPAGAIHPDQLPRAGAVVMPRRV